jgi:GT2 family glycosyltransferase
MTKNPWEPLRVIDIDLLMRRAAPADTPLPGPVLALVRLHTRSVSVINLTLAPGESVDDHHERLASAFRQEISKHWAVFGCEGTTENGESAEEAACLRRREDLLTGAPSVSVIVATHDRPDMLRRCLESLLRQAHQPLEIIVVDNARSSDTTERLIGRDFATRSVRYVREDVPGLGRAHNAGLAHARGDVLAITDDDVSVDRYWLSALLESFVQHDAGCVTGLILPMELRTLEQSWVEQYGGFARGFDQRTFSLKSPPPGDPLFPFTPGRLGSGANMAFDRAMLESIGGFDPALGAGTKARGGDDLAAFAQTLLAGSTVVYQPDAVVYHAHHSELAALQRMAYGYGVGLGAYLASLVSTQPRLAGELVRRIPAGVRYMTRADSEKNRNIRADYPRRLVAAERLGLLLGPFSYIASRREGRSARHRAQAQEGGR